MKEKHTQEPKTTTLEIAEKLTVAMGLKTKGNTIQLRKLKMEEEMGAHKKSSGQRWARTDLPRPNGPEDRSVPFWCRSRQVFSRRFIVGCLCWLYLRNRP
jgi:hypothetical protein